MTSTMKEKGVTNAPKGTTTATLAEVPQREKKISIVGFTESRNQAPWGDPDWEIWICNNLWKFCPDSWHRLYDLHSLEEIRSDKEHEGFLRGTAQKHVEGRDVKLDRRQVVSFYPQQEWPTAAKFPRDEVTDALGRYFTNSISWMVAHALLENVTELHVYGVDMATGTEYASQRPSVEYLLGIAVGMGVQVYIPPQSDLLKVTAMYGAEDDSALFAKMAEREGELVRRAQQMEQQRHQAELALAQIQGALETTRYIKTVWSNPRANRDGTPKGLEDGKTDLAAVPEPVEVS